MGKGKKAVKTAMTAQETGGSDQFVTFWGVRGTMPTPGVEFARYGGHTSCVEIRTPGSRPSSIVCDAGSGLSHFGEAALRRGERTFHILLSHMHYDHMLGFQKFGPLFRTDTEIHIYGLAKGGFSLRELFARYFAFPFFPIEFKDLASLPHLHFHELNPAAGVTIAGCRVEVGALNHPQQALGFRVWSQDGSTSVVYATDHEHGTSVDETLVAFSKDATLFLYDSTFSQEAYPRHVGWGHSTAFMGAKLAALAGVRAFGLFHHDPDARDELLERTLLPEAQKIYAPSFLTREGETLHLPTLRERGLDAARAEGGFFHFTQKSQDLKTG